MARFSNKHQEGIGLSPEHLHFIGKKQTDKVTLNMMDYDSERIEERQINDIAEAFYLDNTTITSWLNIVGIHDEDIMESLALGFDLDRVILADVMNTQARPKIVEYDNCVYISVKILLLDEKTDKIQADNFVMILKKNVLITFQERSSNLFDPVCERIRNNRKRHRICNCDYLLYALLDVIVDHYNYIMSCIGNNVEVIEEVVIDNPPDSILEDISQYKKEINYIQKSIKPVQEIVINLLKLDSEFIRKDMVIHFKDLQNNINLACETGEGYRLMLSDQLNIYHTTMTSKLNDIMNFLTIISVIFAPITFIVGVYGMNFENMPELKYKYGYYIVMAVMALISTLMVYFFKRKKWF